jgi:hypothetical protein
MQDNNQEDIVAQILEQRSKRVGSNYTHNSTNSTQSFLTKNSADSKKKKPA